jgi:hypothetical protein
MDPIRDLLIFIKYSILANPDHKRLTFQKKGSYIWLIKTSITGLKENLLIILHV